MRTGRSRYLLMLLAATLVPAMGAVHWYVNANNPYIDPDDPVAGKSWLYAFPDLQTALGKADEGDIIWVAKSTPAQPAYYPSVRYPNPNDPDPRRATFRVKAGVKVYGGFRGRDEYTDPNYPYVGESLLSERDPEHNLTILDGDLDQNDQLQYFPYGASFTDNAYHVVIFRNTVAGVQAKFSGFVVRNGHADGAPETEENWLGDDSGAGIMVLEEGSNADSYPLLDRLVLRDNYADRAGAGILIAGAKNIHLANCRFEHNWIGDENDPNLPDGFGAGLAVHPVRGRGVTLQNGIFYNNHIVHGTGAGASIEPSGNSVFANCTFYDNTAGTPENDPNSLAGAFYCPPLAIGYLPSARINNCIVWNNTQPQLGAAVDACFSDVEDGSWWTGSNRRCPNTNISQTPQFRAPAVGNLTLKYVSPCIDTGNTMINNDPNYPLLLQDFTDVNEDGYTNVPMPKEMSYPGWCERPRILIASGQIDMGAYELGTCPGDFDGDGSIGLQDLVLLLHCFGGTCSNYPYDCCFADMNDDATIDLNDLTLILSLFGTECQGLLGGGDSGGGENAMMGQPDPLIEWLLSATPEEILTWYYSGMPPVGGGDR
ncbi:MAG: right-handed parallel beta-helix repeat-containing protein [Planctomycetes bacterium]|nr:right-handed parallel beta-helix repeat-containing protein [Planctomycetota bacterium]